MVAKICNHSYSFCELVGFLLGQDLTIFSGLSIIKQFQKLINIVWHLLGDVMSKSPTLGFLPNAFRDTCRIVELKKETVITAVLLPATSDLNWSKTMATGSGPYQTFTVYVAYSTLTVVVVMWL